MALRFLSVFAAALLLAACETAPKESGSASSEGDAAAATAPAPPSTPTVEPSTPAVTAKKEVLDPRRDLVVNVGDRVFFDFDKYNLKPDARETLERQAAWLKRYPAVTVAIEGHADERGTREYNLALGERRANAAKDYLLALGINPNRVSTISYGKERPAVAGSNETAWAQNRRAVTVVKEPKVGS